MIDIQFLKTKEYRGDSGWGGSYTHLFEISGCNMYQLTDKVFCFTVYNLLPVNGSELDGHYKFYVNIDTFNYCFYRDSYYGSLTYVTPLDDNFNENYNEQTKKIVESYISTALQNSYIRNYDTQINLPLIEDNPEHNLSVLVCDTRGYVWSELRVEQKTEKAYIAISKIEQDYKILNVEDITIEFGKSKTRNLVEKQSSCVPEDLKIKGLIKIIETLFKFDDKDFIFIYKTYKFENSKTNLSQDAWIKYKEINFGDYSFNDMTPAKYKKIIPSIIKSKFY